MPTYIYIVAGVGWFGWLLPFVINGWSFKTPKQRDNRALWGITLQCIAYSLLFQSHFWEASQSAWRIAFGSAFLLLADLLAWTGVRALGKHLRFDAAVSTDHELVRSGPYRVIRHPIYASMLCLLLGLGTLLTPVPMLLVSLAIFIAGTEIRVRVEDALLAAAFGEPFRQYRRSVRAYIPFIR